MCDGVRDVLITVYNLNAVVSYPLKDMKPNQRPTLLTSMLAMEDKLRDPRGKQWADINRSAEHLPHCLLMDFQTLFGLFVNIAGNMEYSEAAEQGNPINPQVLEQAEAQAGELTRKLGNNSEEEEAAAGVETLPTPTSECSNGIPVPNAMRLCQTSCSHIRSRALLLACVVIAHRLDATAGMDYLAPPAIFTTSKRKETASAMR
jgi:hypothetical protein